MSDAKKTAKSDKADTGKAAFWTSIPSNIKTVTAFIAAISGLLLALTRIGILGGDKAPEVSTAVPSTLSASISTSPCYEFDTKSFEYIPYSLYYSLKDSKKTKEFMYWFHIKGKNNCDYPLDITIAFESLRDTPLIEPERKSPLAYTIDPGETFDKKMHPGFRFLPQDINDTLEVNWKVSRNETESPLKQGKVDIEVRSKNKFLWNLPKPGGAGIVDQEFLLGSLTAWTKPNDARIHGQIKTMMKTIERDAGLMEYARNLLGACYKLFYGNSEEKITLVPSHVAFPPIGAELAERIIRSPGKVLEARESDPLEAALLISALAAKKLIQRGVRVVLVFTDDQPSSILLAWLDGAKWNLPDQWHAINMDKLSTMSFSANETLASSQLEKIIKSEQAMTYELMAEGQDGVYYTDDRNTIAIDLNRAGNYYGIKSLP